MTINKKIRKRLLFAHRRLREWKMIAKGLLSTRHPVLAHIIPTSQTPAGGTLSLQKRRRLLARAEQYDFLIFEDDP